MKGESSTQHTGTQTSTHRPGLGPPTEDTPPPYSELDQYQHAESLNIPYAGKDLRRRSTDSLRPPGPSEQRDRRILLLIYIHGFQGNERSFRSFPAHVHNVITTLLSESHVVHTKIYPRYRSKKHITVARDDFSRWLSPHESPKTDVILFGHSMGGLLSAEVALKPSQDARGLQHRLIGTVNFDVPFLGMHPGVIKTGLESLFSPAPETVSQDPETGQLYTNSTNQSGSSVNVNETASNSSASSAFMQSMNPFQNPDPNFNPTYENDVILPARKGWRNVMHFVNKHSDNLLRGTKQMVTAHMEFTGAMVDYNALKSRYARLRSLAELNDDVRRSIVGNAYVPPRVRFVNYYTASTGRPKRPKSPKDESGEKGSRQGSRRSSPSPPHSRDSQDDGHRGRSAAAGDSHLKPEAAVSTSRAPSAPNSPRLSLHEHTQDGVIEKRIEDLDIGESAQARTDTPTLSPQGDPPMDTPPPVAPVEPNSSFNLQEALPSPSHERGKSPVGSSRQSVQSSIPSITSPYTSTTDTRSPDLSRYTTVDSTTTQSESTRGLDQTRSHDISHPPKPKKDRKFCSLPPRDSQGNRDPAWVRVFMKDVDEVAAHCGLFVETCPAYASLVSDVSERVKDWVQDAEGERVAKELDGQYEY